MPLQNHFTDIASCPPFPCHLHCNDITVASKYALFFEDKQNPVKGEGKKKSLEVALATFPSSGCTGTRHAVKGIGEHAVPPPLLWPISGTFHCISGAHSCGNPGPLSPECRSPAAWYIGLHIFQLASQS